MTAIYLELDSTYRDRNLWPEPSEFEVSTSQTGRNNQNMLDPVCIAAPEISWTGNFFDSNALGSTFIQGQIIDLGIGFANSSTEIILKALAPSQFREQFNYYLHAVVRRTVLGDTSFVRITSSEYLGDNRMKIKVVPGLIFNTLDIVSIVDPTDFSDPNNAFIFIPTGSENEQDYRDKLLFNETLTLSVSIKYYDATLGIATLSGSVLGWLPTHNFSIRKQNPNYVFVAGLTSTPSNVVFPVIPNDFSNWFIRVQAPIYNDAVIQPQGETRKIVQYNAPNATVAPAFSASPAGLFIELMQQGYDNVNPFTWRGTVSQEIPTYRVRLIRLILPNLPMITSRGGNPSVANYFYVELGNSGTQNMYSICSNNPNAVKANFRVTVKDLVRLKDLEFITLEGDVNQIMRIRIDSNLYIKVTTSSGELFKTVIKDTTSPLSPKYNIQVNALFEFIPV